MEEPTVLCGANSYEEKYYLNPQFQALPQSIQDELQILCVTFTEEVGGILLLLFDGEGRLQLTVNWDEEDLLYDEIGSGLLLKRIQKEKRELFAGLEQYYAGKRSLDC